MMAADVSWRKPESRPNPAGPERLARSRGPVETFCGRCPPQVEHFGDHEILLLFIPGGGTLTECS